jgi:hypothetical protein
MQSGYSSSEIERSLSDSNSSSPGSHNPDGKKEIKTATGAIKVN